MDPRYRFVVVIGFLSTLGWGAHVLWTLLNDATITWATYQNQVLFLAPSTLAGLALVWLIANIIQWRKEPTTGFEPNARDEFGTVFEMRAEDGKMHPFKISLDKFLPHIIAPPAGTEFHPLEAELIGFLNGYRHWPLELTPQGHSKGEVSLYEQSMARWHVMRHLPGSGPLHRCAALAKDLALTHAYKETRKEHNLPPLKANNLGGFFRGLTVAWKKDKISFSQRCQAHGGITAFVASTFPALRAMGATPEGQAQQRALLTALRFHQTPNLLPLNAGPLAREILDYLWRADAQLQQLDVNDFDNMNPDQLKSLQDEIAVHWLGLLSQLAPTGSPHSDMGSFRQDNGDTWVHLGELLSKLGPLLRPELRQQLQLWVIDPHTPPQAHPAWSHLAPVLQDAGLIASTWEGQDASNGAFTLQLDGLAWGPAILLKTDPLKHAPVLREWGQVPGWAGSPEVLVDINQLLARAQARIGDVDSRIAELF